VNYEASKKLQCPRESDSDAVDAGVGVDTYCADPKCKAKNGFIYIRTFCAPSGEPNTNRPRYKFVGCIHALNWVDWHTAI